MKISKSHPRYTSLKTRERIVAGVKKGITALDGLIPQGRGEAFDYLLGEKTHDFAKTSIEMAAALLLTAKHPVISVNGNVAALVPKEIIMLANEVDAVIEVNIFHPSKKRELLIRKHLLQHGAKKVLLPQKTSVMLYVESNRKHVHKQGIFIADVVFAPLEDGDRAWALIKNRKKVITVDVNPLSRTAKSATVTIVDNIVRTLPVIIEVVKRYKHVQTKNLEHIIRVYDNKKNLKKAVTIIRKNLS